MASTAFSGKDLRLHSQLAPVFTPRQEQSHNIPGYTNPKVISRLAKPVLETRVHVVQTDYNFVQLRIIDSCLKSKLNTIGQQLQQQDGICAASSNQHIGSLAVSFDKGKLFMPQVLGMLQQLVVSQPSTSLSEVKETILVAARKSFDFWKEQSLNFISLITGVVVTGQLGIEGWAAIPACLLTAVATRKLIEYLECKLPALDTKEADRESVRSLPEKSAALNQKSSTTDRVDKIAYSVVHTIPGRIRLSVRRIAYDLEYTRRLEKLLKADAPVTSIRLNRDAASIVINYQCDAVPVSHWVSMLQLANKANFLEVSCPSEVLVVETNASANFTEVKTQRQLSEPAIPDSYKTGLTSTDCTEAKNQLLLTEPASPTSVAIDSTSVMLQPTLEVASLWAELKSPALTVCLEGMAQLPAHRTTPVISVAKVQQLALICQASLGWCCRLPNRVAARVAHLNRLRQTARDAVVAIRTNKVST